MTTATALAPVSGVTQMSLDDALALGQDVWDRVLARSGSSNPFMSWAWHRAWADGVSSAERDACQVLVATSPEGQVEALFPLRLHPARFHRVSVPTGDWTIGDLGCPDNLDLLATPEADLEGLVDALGDLPWQVLRMENVTEGAEHVARVRAACEARGWAVRERALWRCPYLELPDTWEELLERLGRNLRRNVRRYERHLEKTYDVRVTDYATRWEEGWRHLRRLHDQRWAGHGALGIPGVEELHRSFGAWLAERDQLWLVTLDLNGTPAAAWYGISWGGTHYGYQSGWDQTRIEENVGTVLMTLMMRRAIAQGYRTFDFLRGEEWYKTLWTDKARTCYELVVIRGGWRGNLLRGLDWVARRRARVWVPE